MFKSVLTKMTIFTGPLAEAGSAGYDAFSVPQDVHKYESPSSVTAAAEAGFLSSLTMSLGTD